MSVARRFSACFAAAFLFSIAGPASAIPIVVTADGIPDVLRSGFNGFESAPNTLLLTSHLEGGILVEAIGDTAWTTCTGFPPPACQAQEGARSWYHADAGYTRITLASGWDFQDVGMRTSAGHGSFTTVINYAALLDGVVQTSGSVLLPHTGLGYLGFMGGGFDELWLEANRTMAGMPNSGLDDALQIDSIEIRGSTNPVPEPASLLLLGSGAIGMLSRSHRRTTSHRVPR